MLMNWVVKLYTDLMASQTDQSLNILFCCTVSYVIEFWAMISIQNLRNITVYLRKMYKRAVYWMFVRKLF